MYKATVVLRKDGIREILCKDFGVGNGILSLWDVDGLGRKTPMYMFPLDMVMQVKGEYINETDGLGNL